MKGERAVRKASEDSRSKKGGGGGDEPQAEFAEMVRSEPCACITKSPCYILLYYS